MRGRAQAFFGSAGRPRKPRIVSNEKEWNLHKRRSKTTKAYTKKRWGPLHLGKQKHEFRSPKTFGGSSNQQLLFQGLQFRLRTSKELGQRPSGNSMENRKISNLAVHCCHMWLYLSKTMQTRRLKGRAQAFLLLRRRARIQKIVISLWTSLKNDKFLNITSNTKKDSENPA